MMTDDTGTGAELSPEETAVTVRVAQHIRQIHTLHSDKPASLDRAEDVDHDVGTVMKRNLCMAIDGVGDVGAMVEWDSHSVMGI
jgi:hypothetical protein